MTRRAAIAVARYERVTFRRAPVVWNPASWSDVLRDGISDALDRDNARDARFAEMMARAWLNLLTTAPAHAAPVDTVKRP